MATLLENQDPDGMWHQLIDEPASYKETSGTAMFTYAMLVGVKHGWLDKKTYAPAATKGWLALVSYINDEDEITNVCEGTNIKNDKNHYIFLTYEKTYSFADNLVSNPGSNRAE